MTVGKVVNNGGVRRWMDDFQRHLRSSKFIGVEYRCAVCSKFLGCHMASAECNEHPAASKQVSRKDLMSTHDIENWLDRLREVLL